MYVHVLCKWMCYVNGCVKDACGRRAGGRDAFKTRTHTQESGGKNHPCVSHTKITEELTGQPFLILKRLFSYVSHSTLEKSMTKQQEHLSFYCE